MSDEKEKPTCALRIWCQSGAVMEIRVPGPVTPDGFGGMINNVRANGYFLWRDPYVFIPGDNISIIMMVADEEMQVVDLRKPNAEPVRMN